MKEQENIERLSDGRRGSMNQKPDFHNVRGNFDRIYNKRISHEILEAPTLKDKVEYLDAKLNQVINKASMPSPATI